MWAMVVGVILAFIVLIVAIFLLVAAYIPPPRTRELYAAKMNKETR